MALARTNAPDEEDIKLANKIYSDFEEGNFESSAELIDKLSKKRVDIKIHFNHSVIDYRKQGCVLTDEFLIVLQYTQLLVGVFSCYFTVTILLKVDNLHEFHIKF